MLWLCRLQTACFKAMLAVLTTEGERELALSLELHVTLPTFHSGETLTVSILNVRQLCNVVCVSPTGRNGPADQLAPAWLSHYRLVLECHLSFCLANR